MLTVEEILKLEELAAAGVKGAVSLYKTLQAHHATMRPIEDVLAEANATADDVVNEAEAQIKEATTVHAPPAPEPLVPPTA